MNSAAWSGFAAASVLLQCDEYPGRLHHRRHQEERRGRALEPRVGGAHEREHEEAEAGAQRQQHAARRAELVPPHADEHRQPDEQEDAAEVGEQARHDPDGLLGLEVRTALEGRRDLVDRQAMAPDQVHDFDQRVVPRRRHQRVPVTQPTNSAEPYANGDCALVPSGTLVAPLRSRGSRDDRGLKKISPSSPPRLPSPYDSS